jgi:hypothetical protein
MRSPLLLTIALLILSAPAVAQVPAFDLQPLPELPGSTSVATGLGYSCGGYPGAVGWSTRSGGANHPVVWTDTAGQLTATPLPLLDPTRSGYATTVYLDPLIFWVAGASTDGAGLEKPVLWSKGCSDTAFGAPDTLPTLAGAEGYAVMPGYGNSLLPVGVSRTGAGVDKAVVWGKDLSGVWQIGVLPHYSPTSAGAATGIFCEDPGNYGIPGWAVNDVADTIPQVWLSSDDGANWARTPLPLLPGGAQGQANSIITLVNFLKLAGWSEDAAGKRRTAVWTSTDSGLSWTVMGLPPAAGRANCEGSSYMGAEDEIRFPSYMGTEEEMIVGTSYDVDPLVDGVATLWVNQGGTFTTHDLNDLVTGPGTLNLRSGKRITRSLATGIHVAGFGTDTGSATARAPAGPHAFLLAQSGGTAAADLLPDRTDRLALSIAPNPFAQGTTVSFALPSASPVRVSVIDVAGRHVASLTNGTRSAGRHSLSWDGRDAAGRAVSPGVYFVRLQSAGQKETTKVTRVR